MTRVVTSGVVSGERVERRRLLQQAVERLEAMTVPLGEMYSALPEMPIIDEEQRRLAKNVEDDIVKLIEDLERLTYRILQYREKGII